MKFSLFVDYHVQDLNLFSPVEINPIGRGLTISPKFLHLLASVYVIGHPPSNASMEHYLWIKIN